MDFQSKRWPRANSPQHHKEAHQNCPSELLGQWRVTGCVTVCDENEWVSAEHRLTHWRGSDHSASWSPDALLPETSKCAEEGGDYSFALDSKLQNEQSGHSFFIKVLVRGPACRWTKEVALEDCGRKADGTSSSQVNSKLPHTHTQKDFFILFVYLFETGSH